MGEEGDRERKACELVDGASVLVGYLAPFATLPNTKMNFYGGAFLDLDYSKHSLHFTLISFNFGLFLCQ